MIGLIVAWFLGSLKGKWADYKKYKQRLELLEKANKALLHDRIFQACNYYRKQEFITSGDLENLHELYSSYKALNGNGMCERLFNICNTLEIRDDD